MISNCIHKRKISVIALTVLFFFTFSFSVSALPAAEVTSGSGHLSAQLVFGTDNGDGFNIGGQYGIWQELALFGETGDPYTRLGGKYQFHENFAAGGGYILDESIFLGLSTQYNIWEDLDAVGELNLAVSPDDESLSVFYDVGVQYDLPENIDLRISLTDLLYDDQGIRTKIGFGFNF